MCRENVQDADVTVCYHRFVSVWHCSGQPLARVFFLRVDVMMSFFSEHAPTESAPMITAAAAAGAGGAGPNSGGSSFHSMCRQKQQQMTSLDVMPEPKTCWWFVG